MKHRYGIDAVPLPMTAEFACSPGHEIGGCPHVPGAVIAALDINMLVRVQHLGTRATEKAPP